MRVYQMGVTVGCVCNQCKLPLKTCHENTFGAYNAISIEKCYLQPALRNVFKSLH